MFYGMWDWRFTLLISVSILLDYACGIKISDTEARSKKKLYLLCSLTGNLGILGFFKYFNFFAESLQSFLASLGFATQPVVLNIILPVGISFYTFKTLSYTIDVYRGEITPTKNLVDYALYVSFFPQLLAGPIDRAKDLLPQIRSPRCITPHKFYQGCYLVFWGLFQKVFIADNLARIIDPIFDAPPPYNGPTILFAACTFSIQVYCDFAGYSDIARGLGKCMGFDMVNNFCLPFFATSVGEFWRRWHISLSGWFRDYLYTPIVIHRRDWGIWGIVYALILSFVLVGLWHGAQWTFILFGLLQGMMLGVEALTQQKRKKIGRRFSPVITKSVGMLYAFAFFSFSCVVFRAPTISNALQMMHSLVADFSTRPGFYKQCTEVLFFIWPLVCLQLLQFLKKDLLAILTLPVWARAAIYFMMYYFLMVYGVEGGKEFIYFKF